MNPILRALQSGYTPTQVLQFVSQIFEGNSKQKKRGKKGTREVEPLAETQQQGHMFADREREEKGSQLIKSGLKAAALVAGIPAGMRAVTGAANTLGNLLGGGAPPPGAPGNVPNAPAPLGGPPGGGAPVVPAQPTAPSQPVAPTAAPANAAAGQPAQPVQSNATQILQQMGLLPHIKALHEAGNPPQTTAQVIKSIVKPPQKEWLKSQTEKGIEELVHEHLAMEPQHPEQPQIEEKIEKPMQPEQSQPRLAALPSGEVGPIVDEKQGIATIELPDGKKRRQKMSEIEQEDPEFERQIMNLIEAIPEEERSAVVAFASYNPESDVNIGGEKTRSPWMGVQFHNGDLYLYPDVSREQYDRVVSKTVPAKTSGENPWHAWVKGKESRGAGMYEIIKELEATFGKNFVKLEAKHGYDYFKRIRQAVNKHNRKKRTP